MDPILSVVALSVVLGAVIVFVFFKSYFLKQRSEVQTIAKPELHSDPKKPSKPPQPIFRKSHAKHHSHASGKDQNKRHHPLDLNTLKGHADSVAGLCFSSDGRNLATEEFRPERWLDEDGMFQPESPFKFTAFQAGPRICLGKEFAYRQMKIFSAVLVHYFVFKLSDENKSVTYRTMITLHVDGGLHVRAFPRCQT
ncbi:Cytochrome P450 - like 10 [Theobroma cacao]|nr:Cytochrome P450 - like 10 [Theobroma cacao]